MQSNQFEVCGYRLEVSMTTLFRADCALEKAGRKGVTDTFASVIEAMDLSSGEVTIDSVAKALRVVSLPTLVTVLSAFLKMPEKDALDGPLSKGTPQDWVMGLFNGLIDNSPNADDVEADEADNADVPEGNA
jgi:hypothetical protein